MIIRVHGKPAPQGSKKAFPTKTGRIALAESSKDVMPWREAVKYAIPRVAQPFTGPVSTEIVFYLRKPKSARKNVEYVSKKPDIDKLVRSTLDGLTDAGVWTDDSQVAYLSAGKCYATDSCPIGAVIVVEDLARKPQSFTALEAVVDELRRDIS